MGTRAIRAKRILFNMPINEVIVYGNFAMLEEKEQLRPGCSRGPKGARASANLYSIVSCARVNGLEPYAYLHYLFGELAKANIAEALEALLPWNVKSLLK
jgi:hypothetical protein